MIRPRHLHDYERYRARLQADTPRQVWRSPDAGNITLHNDIGAGTTGLPTGSRHLGRGGDDSRQLRSLRIATIAICGAEQAFPALAPDQQQAILEALS